MLLEERMQQVMLRSLQRTQHASLPILSFAPCPKMQIELALNLIQVLVYNTGTVHLASWPGLDGFHSKGRWMLSTRRE